MALKTVTQKPLRGFSYAVQESTALRWDRLSLCCSHSFYTGHKITPDSSHLQRQEHLAGSSFREVTREPNVHSYYKACT